MKKNILTLWAFALVSITLINCKNEAKVNNEETAMVSTKQNAVKYSVIIEESSINWQGFKPTGSHNGTISIENGEFNISDGSIQNGKFLIDMSSIKESKGSTRLEGHLKSADFFDVEQFPTASFEITALSETNGNNIMSGNLTIKGKTNNISFPVSLSSGGDSYTISSDIFTIDRSKWDIRYKSKSFFNDLKDKFINDDIELKITVKANKSI